MARSRRAARELIASGRVRVNGYRQRKGVAIGAGDRIEVAEAPPSGRLPLIESKVILQILYEDGAILVVAKPPLMPCHPIASSETATVITLLAHDYPEVAELGSKPFEGGLVHRLDNGTSGALIVARTHGALALMRESLHAGQIYRRYEALASGQICEPIEIALPIAHHRKNPARMVLVDEPAHFEPAGTAARIVRGAYRGVPREAFTRIEPVTQIGSFTLVNVIPRTGRRHQIRVHLASRGWPIANDELYGGPPMPSLAPGRLWLHLAELAFDSPSGVRVRVTAPRPPDLAALPSDQPIA